jgi:hypothetical protein
VDYYDKLRHPNPQPQGQQGNQYCNESRFERASKKAQVCEKTLVLFCPGNVTFYLLREADAQKRVKTGPIF